MKITEHNVTTGEIAVRDMTASEAAQHEKDKASILARNAEQEAKAAAKAELLTKLGITADEAALLLG